MPIIIAIVAYAILFISGTAISNNLPKTTPTPTPISSPLPTKPPETPTPTITIIPTQKPQSTYSVEQCLRDMEAKLNGFKKIALSQGHSDEETSAFIEMARAAEVQKCNSGINSNQKNTIEKRLDNIEDELETRKQWEIICGDRGYNSMIGACN